MQDHLLEIPVTPCVAFHVDEDKRKTYQAESWSFPSIRQHLKIPLVLNYKESKTFLTLPGSFDKAGTRTINLQIGCQA